MFNNYKIIDNVLYLYVDDKCEIGSLFNDNKNIGIIDKIKTYIKDKKIKFNGTKVVLLLSGLMLGSVYLNSAFKTYNYDVYKDNKYVYNIVDKSIPDATVEEKIDEIINEASEVIKEKNSNEGINEIKVINNNLTSKKINNRVNISSYDNSDYKENNVVEDKVITLRRTNGEVVQLNLEEYLIGVVAAEMPASFNIEALKAQAVVARTYTLKLIESGRVITDDISTQVYKNNSELKSMWGPSYSMYYNKIRNVVSSTKGMCIKYNGVLIDAVYHSTSNGYTEDSVNVWGNNIPYLKSVTSPWDTSAPSFLRSQTIDFEKITNMLETDFNNSSSIEIISRDDSNRISKIKFNENIYSGVEIRNKLGLRSADFDFDITGEGVVFTTRGYGHGVGMSQYGANAMAKVGYSYEQILKHYYSGVEIVKL